MPMIRSPIDNTPLRHPMAFLKLRRLAPRPGLEPTEWLIQRETSVQQGLEPEVLVERLRCGAYESRHRGAHQGRCLGDDGLLVRIHLHGSGCMSWVSVVACIGCTQAVGEVERDCRPSSRSG